MQRPALGNLGEDEISLEKIDYTELIDGDSADEQCVAVGSEEFRKQELASLEKLGSWQPSEPDTEADVAEGTIVSDFPLVVNKQVEFYLDQFQTKQRRYFIRSMARAGRYLPMIRRELKKADLPQDLAYLAFVESGFMPMAYSHAGAMGLWQFMKYTGRKYGLRVDPWVDERRDPEKATKAAIGYLSYLYSRFDSWYLAVAGYNAGEGKIASAIKRYKTHDFWQLANQRYLKLETKSYIPKLIAAIIIAGDPETFGFREIKHDKQLQYDELRVPPGISLPAVAKVCKTTAKELRTLNPELRTNYTPANQGEYRLRLPRGTRNLVAQKLPALQPMAESGFKVHVVRKGENLTRICRHYNVNKITLLKANNLRNGKLKPGQRLRIPYKQARVILLTKNGKRHPGTGIEDGDLIVHTIQSGETLSHIAAKYHVSTKKIMEWNGLKSARSIRAGKPLALYSGQTSQNIAMVSAGKKKSKNVMLSASPKRKVQTEKKKAVIAKQTCKVAKGDSLWSIARRYGVSTTDLKQWNNLASTKLKPGMKLVVAGEASHGKLPAGKTYYQVRNGDSIWTIARRFQVSARELRQWNNLKTNLIRPGKRLVIKGV